MALGLDGAIVLAPRIVQPTHHGLHSAGGIIDSQQCTLHVGFLVKRDLYRLSVDVLVQKQVHVTRSEQFPRADLLGPGEICGTYASERRTKAHGGVVRSDLHHQAVHPPSRLEHLLPVVVHVGLKRGRSRIRQQGRILQNVLGGAAPAAALVVLVQPLHECPFGHTLQAQIKRRIDPQSFFMDSFRPVFPLDET